MGTRTSWTGHMGSGLFLRRMVAASSSLHTDAGWGDAKLGTAPRNTYISGKRKLAQALMNRMGHDDGGWPKTTVKVDSLTLSKFGRASGTVGFCTQEVAGYQGGIVELGIGDCFGRYQDYQRDR